MHEQPANQAHNASLSLASPSTESSRRRLSEGSFQTSLSSPISSSSSSRQRRHNFIPLAPRDTKPSPALRRPSEPASGRRPRLSHRSRAGCWTCRGRKVKCDEARPRCGPCMRLNRECDWEHRWAFTDSTANIQGRHSNVTTMGNAVWDSTVRSSSFPPAGQFHDDLPEFASLTTDEDRERKATTRTPGTFSVVATPDSFYNLPEYATVASANRMRSISDTSPGGLAGSRYGTGRGHVVSDPNTVVLDRFEEISPPPFSPIISTGGSRSGSVSDPMQHLSLSTPLVAQSRGILAIPPAPSTLVLGSNDHLIFHFRQYIVPRLIQPQVVSPDQSLSPNIFEQEAADFPPLYHAICAIADLNFACNGRASMEDSMQHYHQALSVYSSAAGIPHNLLSDGVFFRHFLLFIYDICIPMQIDASSEDSDSGGAGMWAEHLSHLRLLALQRFQFHNGTEPHAHLIWTICELDMYACLLGCGNCDFVETVLTHNMLPPIQCQIPPSPTDSNACPYLPTERQIFPPVLRLNEGIVLRTAKIAQTAQVIRNEALKFAGGSIPGPVYARWRAAAEGLSVDLQNFWNGAYPKSIPSGGNGDELDELPERVRMVLENATLLYHAATLYLLTTLHPSPPQPAIAVLSHHILSIVTITTNQLRFHANHPQQPPSLRPQIFALLMAAFAAAPEDDNTRITCAGLIGQLERSGIGVGAGRVRRIVPGLGDWRVEEARTGYRLGWGLVGMLRRMGVGIVNCGV